MAETWTVRRERSNRFALHVLVWIARRLGRRTARFVLRFVVVYYMFTAPGARAASADYLRRVLVRRPRWRDVYRQMYSFATVALDRVYLFGPEVERLSFTSHGLEAFGRCYKAGRGAIIMVAHFGSFEMLRVLGESQDKFRLRVLMDRASGAKANEVLEAINPGMAGDIIDTSQSDVDRVLKVKAALDRGEMVGLMADRYRPGERTVDVNFLGGRAPMPASPWLLAGLTHAPVLMAFGVYRGGNRYDLYCEEFSTGFRLARSTRLEQARSHAQAYADRLAEYVEQAPYNWFNFYQFWYNDRDDRDGQRKPVRN